MKKLIVLSVCCMISCDGYGTSPDVDISSPPLKKTRSLAADIGQYTSYRDVLAAAFRNDSDAQFRLGNIYRIGQEYGIQQDYKQAAYWFEQASQLGHCGSKHSLALMYAKGMGVDIDYRKAINLFTEAAFNGYMASQYGLAEMYARGVCVERDYTYAAYWYQRAAEQGHALSQWKLGAIFEYGLHGEQSNSIAIEWYKKAAEHGSVDAKHSLSLIYLKSKDYSNAFEWGQNAVAQNHAHAKFVLSYMYQHGLGVEEDIVKATQLLEDSAQQGDASALHALGNMYKVSGQYSKAAKMYALAAQKKFIPSICLLGWMYETGCGVKQNLIKTAVLYEEAANRGVHKAQLKLSKMYEKGYGVKQNYAIAAHWLMEAVRTARSKAVGELHCMRYVKCAIPAA